MHRSCQLLASASAHRLCPKHGTGKRLTAEGRLLSSPNSRARARRFAKPHWPDGTGGPLIFLFRLTTTYSPTRGEHRESTTQRIESCPRSAGRLAGLASTGHSLADDAANQKIIEYYRRKSNLPPEVDDHGHRSHRLQDPRRQDGDAEAVARRPDAGCQEILMSPDGKLRRLRRARGRHAPIRSRRSRRRSRPRASRCAARRTPRSRSSSSPTSSARTAPARTRRCPSR